MLSEREGIGSKWCWVMDHDVDPRSNYREFEFLMIQSALSSVLFIVVLRARTLALILHHLPAWDMCGSFSSEACDDGT